MGDGHTYLVSGSSQNGQGVMWILDGSTRGLARTIMLDAQDVVESIAVADVDASGSPKILVGVDGPTGPRVEARDGTTGTRLWHTNFGSEPAIQLLKIKSADVNHDGHADIVVHVITRSSPSVIANQAGVGDNMLSFGSAPRAIASSSALTPG